MRPFIRRHQLAVFFVLAFALSWWPWPMTRLNADSVAMIPWGPAVAALVVTGIVGGWSGLAALIKGLGRWRVGPGWWIAALGIPVLSWIAAALIAQTFLDTPISMALGWADLGVFAITIVTTGVVNGPLTEEIAWRGFALPRMLRRAQPLIVALTLGVVWFAWHLPLLATETTRPPILFAVSVLSFSVILTWLYVGTGGSLLIAVLFHSAVNTTASFVVPSYAEADRITIWWVFASLIAAIAFVIGRTHLLRPPTDLRREAGDMEPSGASIPSA